MKEHVFHDIDTYELSVCARQYLYVKHLKKFDGQGTEFSEGVISFVTDDGYFASLGHSEDHEYLEKGAIDLYSQQGVIDELEVIDWALRTLPSMEVYKTEKVNNLDYESCSFDWNDDAIEIGSFELEMP